MTEKELIEKLKTVDPDTEVVVVAPDYDYYSYGYYEYSIDREGIDVRPEKFSICVKN